MDDRLVAAAPAMFRNACTLTCNFLNIVCTGRFWLINAYRDAEPPCRTLHTNKAQSLVKVNCRFHLYYSSIKPNACTHARPFLRSYKLRNNSANDRGDQVTLLSRAYAVDKTTHPCNCRKCFPHCTRGHVQIPCESPRSS